MVKDKVAIVFGGGGFIGRHLLTFLASTGEYAELISADICEVQGADSGVTQCMVDVREPIPDSICAQVTEIYNLAAVHRTPGHEDWEYYCTNVLGAIHVTDFARRKGANKLLFASSIAVYGAGEETKDEDSIPVPDSAYGYSKLLAERIHRSWQSEKVTDRKLAIVRPGVIYGLGESGNFTRLAKLLRKGYFVFPGRTDTIKACGYVKDLVSSMSFMLERADPVIVYNFCHSEQYTTEQICRSFSRITQYRQARVIMPLPLMLFVGWVFEILAKVGIKTSVNRARIWKLVRSNNIISKRLPESGFVHKYDIDQALLDWKNSSADQTFS